MYQQMLSYEKYREQKREHEHNLINILVNASLLIVTNHHSNSKMLNFHFFFKRIISIGE